MKRIQTEICILEQECLASEENFLNNWQPERLDEAEFYNKFARPLREGGNNHRYPGMKALLDDLLQQKEACFLDCACGAGEMAIWLALHGRRVWAFDFSENAIRVARRSAELSNVADRIQFDVMDARDLKYDDGFFDVIIGKDCLHHLIKYPQAVKELSRVLRPGGKVCFYEPLAFKPLINLLRSLNIRFRGYVGEHMLTRADIGMLEQSFDEIHMSHHVVFSVFTRLIASTHRPLRGIRKRICTTLVDFDLFALRYLPVFQRFAACAYIQLVKRLPNDVAK